MNNKTQFKAHISPENATNQDVEWSIQNITGQAEINQEGIVTPKSCGLVRITASSLDGSDAKSKINCALIDMWKENGHENSTDEDFILWYENIIKTNENISNNIGEIFWWPKTIPPNDALYCDGRAISREIYKDLFAIIGTQYGAGNGTTTFNLPDLRGEFIRGYDPNNLRDPEGSTREIGKHQDGTEIPNGYATSVNLVMSKHIPNNFDIMSPDIIKQRTVSSSETAQIYNSYYTARPTNINLLPCIRYKTLFTDNEVLRMKARLDWEAAIFDKEYWTGKYHIDGKKIYGKKINFGNLPNNNEISISLNINNVNIYTSVIGTVNNKIGKINASIPFSHHDSTKCITLFIVDNELHVVTGCDRSEYILIATLEYTCIDR